MADELKPCPFCPDGGKPEMSFNPKTGFHNVQCRHCGIVLWCEAWERRPIEASLLARAETAEADRDKMHHDWMHDRAELIARAEAAEERVEKVKKWRERSLSTECQCSFWYSSRNMCDPSCEWCETDAAGLDSILAPGGGEKEDVK